jgi:NTP pyrophosphatase (non-canonical NTP hydrolase)
MKLPKMIIKDLQARVMETAELKKWDTNIPFKLAGIASEIGELSAVYKRLHGWVSPSSVEQVVVEPIYLEERIGKPLADEQAKNIKNYQGELADIVLRVVHLAGLLNLDLEGYYTKAMRSLNADRFCPVPEVGDTERRATDLLEFYNLQYDAYRRNEQEKMGLALAKMFAYIRLLSKADDFNLIDLAKEKDAKNRARDWSKKGGN